MFLLFGGGLLTAMAAFAGALSFVSEPATDLQWLWAAPNGGWTGSDAATSFTVPARNGSVWLNGDTYVGTIGPDGRTRTVVDMPRNTIATLGLAGAVPAGKLAFYIPPRAEPAFNLSAGFWTPPQGAQRGEWIWPTAGVGIGGDAFVFALVERKTGSGPLDFGTDRVSVLHVRNAADDPWAWHTVYVDVPHTGDGLQWAAAAVLDETDACVYLLGVEAASKAAVLARIAAKDLLCDNVAGGWEVLRSDGQFVPNAEGVQLMRLFEDGQPETSVFFHPWMKLWYTLVLPPFTPHVYIRTAPRITGPWSALQLIYTIPDSSGFVTNETFCYAPKSHPELATTDSEIIFSFVSNSLTTWSPPLPIYVPQMIRTKIIM